MFIRMMRGILSIGLMALLLAGCSSSDNVANSNTAGSMVSGTHYIDADNIDLSVSSIVVSNSGGTPTVSFHVDAGGSNYTELAAGDIRIYFADLVPAGEGTSIGPFSSDYFEQWAYERSSTAGVTFTNTDAANGNYSWTFSAPFGTATSGSGLNTADIDLANHVQRLVLRISGKTLADGTVTNNTVGILDFMAPADGADTTTDTTLQYNKAYVTIQACMECHGPKMANAAHAGGYLDTRACVICHSPFYGSSSHTLGFMATDSAVFDTLVHKIHSAIDMPAFPTRINGNGYVDVTYPQDPGHCVTCHADPDGLTAVSAALLDNWKNHATVEACGSCHINDDYVTGLNPDATSVVESHDPTAVVGYDPTTDPNAPEFNVTLSISAYTNGLGYFDAGETPVITVTLKNHATGADFTDYMTAQDDAGVSGGGLSTATLYVYGPRNGAAPVLTLNASADRGESLLLPSTDPNLLTDATGFHYQLQPIPADMPAGTYMASVQIADYGGLADDDYKTTSVGEVLYFQVGSADVTPNVAGDGCYNCHGDTHMHQAGSHAHNVPFNTDYCNACHDTTGIHGVPIANRVHAVHSASPRGDLYNYSGGVYTLNADRDWHTTFPRINGDCSACHVSGNTSYRTNPYGVPCLGCHGGGAGVIDHMAQNGFIFNDRHDFSSSDSCVACHGSGGMVDVSDVKGP